MQPDFDLYRRRFLRTVGAGFAAAAALPWLDPRATLAADGTLTVALPNNPTTFDPVNQVNHDAMAVSQTIFENLVEVDADGNLKPQLALELPKVSDDGLTSWFDLREDVYFQNGQKFTAEDVKYSFEYVLDPKNKAVRRPIWEPIRRVVAESSHRVRFEFSTPYAPWLNYMTKYMGIFPKGSREKNGDAFKSGPIGVGTGPGVFVQARENDYVELARNPNYWRKGVPAWSKLVFRIVPADATRIAYLMANEVQIIGAPPPRDYARLKQQPNIQGGDKPALGSRFFMSTNNKWAPFDDVDFRKAVSRGIDRRKLAELFYGQLDPCTIPAPPSAWWFNRQANDLLDYNLDAAKMDLGRSKYPTGASFDLLIPSEPYLLDVGDAALVIQADLAKLGIKVNLQKLEATQVIQEMISGRAQSVLQVFMGAADPVFYFRQFYYPGQINFNSTNYKNDELIAAIDQSYRAQTQGALKPIMDRMQMIVAQDCPTVWLGIAHAANLWRNTVKFEVSTGLTMSLRDAIPG